MPLRIPSVTDAELAKAAKAGDSEAFGQLIERYAPAARRLARSVLQHTDDADDAAQDGFLSAWRGLLRFDTERPFGPWLLRIVVNAAQDLRRRRTVRAAESLRGQMPGTEASPAFEAEQAEQRERIGTALAELPERQRLAVVLFDVEGFSHAEIGEVLGVPVGTARSDLFHGRRALRERLGITEGTS